MLAEVRAEGAGAAVSTDLLHRKEELHPTLAAHIVKRRGFSCLMHPLIYSVPHFAPLNAYVNEQFAQKKLLVERAEASGDWMHFVVLHERPYRLEAVDRIAHRMFDADFWKLIGWVWTDSENVWQNKQQWIETLTCGRFHRELMMDEDERAALELMPAVVEVHRGHGSKNASGLSWTLDRDKAAWFARRWKQEGWVTSGKLSKSNVIARFDRRNEQEVVCLPRNVTGKLKQRA